MDAPEESFRASVHRRSGMEEKQPRPQKIVFVLILCSPSQPFRKRTIMCDVITADVGPGKFTFESIMGYSQSKIIFKAYGDSQVQTTNQKTTKAAGLAASV